MHQLQRLSCNQSDSVHIHVMTDSCNKDFPINCPELGLAGLDVSASENQVTWRVKVIPSNEENRLVDKDFDFPVDHDVFGDVYEVRRGFLSLFFHVFNLFSLKYVIQI